MANTSSYVTAAKPMAGGAIFRAPKGSTAPTDCTTELDAAFKCLGYVSEDGVVNTNSPESEKVKAWGGDVVLNSQTEKNDTFKFTLIETLNDEVQKAIYGDSNVTGDLSTGMTLKSTSAEQVEAAWVIQMVLKDGAKKRIFIPQAMITEIGEIKYSDSEAVGYELTISATPDATGVAHYEFMKNA